MAISRWMNISSSFWILIWNANVRIRRIEIINGLFRRNTFRNAIDWNRDWSSHICWSQNVCLCLSHNHSMHVFGLTLRCRSLNLCEHTFAATNKLCGALVPSRRLITLTIEFRMNNYSETDCLLKKGGQRFRMMSW